MIGYHHRLCEAICVKALISLLNLIPNVYRRDDLTNLVTAMNEASFGAHLEEAGLRVAHTS